MKAEVASAIRALVTLVEQDVAELRDSVAQVDERCAAIAREVDHDHRTGEIRFSGESAALNDRMAKLTQAFVSLDERIAALELQATNDDTKGATRR